MNVVLDSSGWVELLADAGRAHLFVPALKAKFLYVPAMVRYEVGRYALAHGGVEFKAQAESAMSKFQTLAFDETLADDAAEIAHQHKLSTADAIIYATTRKSDAELWTQDAHFKHLPSVKYFPKDNPSRARA
jgi:predicted nucleic acid-binding protein